MESKTRGEPAATTARQSQRAASTGTAGPAGTSAARAYLAGGPPGDSADADACSRLVSAAVGLFNRKGYAATTVREIVDAAGVTKPVLYYHFGSKEGIYLALLDSALDEFTSRLEEMEARRGSVRERIEQLLVGVFDLFERHAPIVRLVHAVFYGPSEGAPPFNFGGFQRVFHGAIRRLVEEGVRNGEVRNLAVEDTALVLQALTAMCMDLELVDTPLRPGRDGLRRLLGILFTGIGSDSRFEGE